MEVQNIFKLKCAIFLTFSLIAICSFSVHAQELKSLNYQSHGFTYTKNDTGRIFDLINKAKKLPITSDSAIVLLNDALAQSKQLGFNDGIGQAYMGLGACTIAKGDYDSGIELYKKGLPYCEKAIFHKYLPVMMCNNIGIACMYKEQDKAGIFYYFKALDYYIKKNIARPDILCVIYINLGLGWMKERQYSQAIYYEKKGIQIALKNKDYIKVANAYTSLGGIYIQKGDTLPGRRYSQMGIDISNQYLNDYDKSILQYCAYLNLGISYQHQAPQKALLYFKKALAFGNITPFYSDIGPYTGIGCIYINMKKYKLGKKYLLAGLKNAQTKNQPSSVRDLSFLLAQAYENTGDYKKAYEYQKLYSATADSLMDSTRVIANHELEVKYRTTEQDKELVSEKLQLVQQQNLVAKKNTLILGTILGALLILAVFSVLVFISKNRQRLQAEKIKNLEQEKKIIHLKALVRGEEKERTRIARELHDGVGSLLSAFTISFQAFGKENSEIANSPNYINSSGLLKQISAEIHEAAYNFTPEVLLHNSLIEAIRLYCDYIQFPKSRNIEIDVKGYGEFELLEHEFKLSIYRIVQELLQNIVKHANATQVLVQLVMQDMALNITVEDNGVGFDIGRNDSGLGILNLQSRIKSMNGHISIESAKGNGTSVFIEFDLKAHKQLTSA